MLLVRTMAVLALSATCFAQGGIYETDEAQSAPGTTTWSTRLGFFNRDDSGGADGNPFLDESLTVIEPIIIFDRQVDEDFGYNIKFSYDHVSSASIDRLSNFAAQSGASGDNYFSLDAGFRHKLSSTDDATWHVGLAAEYDYSSIGLGGGWSREFDDRDATLSLNLNGFFDMVKPIRFDGSTDSDDTRTSIAASIGWYQIITPTTHGELGMTYSAQSGFLETAYNAVVVEDPLAPPNPNLANNANGIEHAEVLPDSRGRLSVYGRVRHQLGERDAVELGGRVYDDDWGIGSFDVTPRYLHEFDSGMLLDLKYRYYTQSAADAWAEHFTTLPDERTQDSDLGKFNSSLLSARLIWDAAPSAWDVGLNFASRSDGLDHIFLSLGWTKTY